MKEEDISTRTEKAPHTSQPKESPFPARCRRFDWTPVMKRFSNLNFFVDKSHPLFLELFNP